MRIARNERAAPRRVVMPSREDLAIAAGRFRRADSTRERARRREGVGTRVLARARAPCRSARHSVGADPPRGDRGGGGPAAAPGGRRRGVASGGRAEDPAGVLPAVVAYARPPARAVGAI